ncbi:MAG: hypothetical protein P8Y72_01540 [Anaerolineales bacterium]|jgi:hypothetical protein
MSQRILEWLPGYMWNGSDVVSTGAAIPPTQHIYGEKGDLVYYVRPIFEFGPTVGLFIRKEGLLEWLQGSSASG